MTPSYIPNPQTLIAQVVDFYGLLAHLHTLDDRPWDEWNKDKPMKPKEMARLLEPFGIHPRNHRTSPDKVVKGYYQQDFQKSWTRHLEQFCGTAAPGCGDGSPVAAELQNPSPGISGQQPIARSPQSTRSAVAADLQNPSIGTSGQQPVARSPQSTRSAVAAELQNPSTGTSGHQPAARSPQPTGSVVAAELQNPSIGLSGQKRGARSQQLRASSPQLRASSPQLTRSVVAADLQNSSIGLFRPAARSQEPGANQIPALPTVTTVIYHRIS